MGPLPYLSPTDAPERKKERGSRCLGGGGCGRFRFRFFPYFSHINSGRGEFFINIYIRTLWLFMFFVIVISNMLVTYKYIRG